VLELKWGPNMKDMGMQIYMRTDVKIEGSKGM
jgi:hypothetical protein